MRRKHQSNIVRLVSSLSFEEQRKRIVVLRRFELDAYRGR